MGKGITREKIVEVLADVKYLTREEQATALGIAYTSLWERLKKDKTIEQDVAAAVREGTANTVRNGFARLHTIISNRKSQDKDAIKALELTLKYRGELVDRTENKTEATVRVESEYTPEEDLLIAEAYLRRVKAKSGEDK